MSDYPDRIFVGPDTWNADPIEPCMTEFVRADVHNAEVLRLRARLAAADRLAEAVDLKHWLKTCMELVTALDKCKKTAVPGGMTVQANIANTSFVQVPYSIQLTINGLGLEIEAALSALSAYTATKGGE